MVLEEGINFSDHRIRTTGPRQWICDVDHNIVIVMPRPRVYKAHGLQPG